MILPKTIHRALSNISVLSIKNMNYSQPYWTFKKELVIYSYSKWFTTFETDCALPIPNKNNLPVTFSQIDFAKRLTFIYFTFYDTVTQLFAQTNYQCSKWKQQKLRYMIFLLILQLSQNKVNKNEKSSVTVLHNLHLDFNTKLMLIMT